MRITGQLVDTATGAHLWADRFDGDVGDIFDLQDHVTESVVGAIAPAVEKAEIERAKRKPTESLDAYALYLRGLGKSNQFASRRQANDEALRLFNSAIELDPDFATSYGRAAFCHVHGKSPSVHSSGIPALRRPSIARSKVARTRGSAEGGGANALSIATFLTLDSAARRCSASRASASLPVNASAAARRPSG